MKTSRGRATVAAWTGALEGAIGLPGSTLAQRRISLPRKPSPAVSTDDATIVDTHNRDLQLPGITLHHKFDELATAGELPLKILQMTIVNAAIASGRMDHSGLVTLGFDADLVSLDGNPAAESQKLKRIAEIVRSAITIRPRTSGLWRCAPPQGTGTYGDDATATGRKPSEQGCPAEHHAT